MITKFSKYNKYKIINNKLFISLDDIDIDELKENDIVYILDTEECRDMLSRSFNDSFFIINLLNNYNKYVGYVINSNNDNRFKYSVKIYVPSRQNWYYFPSKYCFKEVKENIYDLYKPRKIEESNRYKVIDNNLLIPITKDNINTLNNKYKIYIENTEENKEFTMRMCGLNTKMKKMFGNIYEFYSFYDGRNTTTDKYHIQLWDYENDTYWDFPASICYIYEKNIKDLYKSRKKIIED